MPKTLLVVDDSTTIRQAARLALAGSEWEVVEALDAHDAREAIETRAPDAILCDAALGDPDGYELARRLRRLPELRPVPIVLMGAKAEPEAARAAGATATLPKPFGSRELLDALEAAVETQAFSGDLAAGPPPDDEPLTLDELEGPLSLGGARADLGTPEDIEIIDLSGDEEFAELDLIEDLEPVVATAGEPWLAPPEPPSAPRQRQAVEEAFVLDLADAFPAARAPADEPNLESLFSAAAGEPLPGVSEPTTPAFEEILDLEPVAAAGEPAAPDPWAPLEGGRTPGPPDTWDEPFLADRGAGPGAPPSWGGQAAGEVAQATERAVREALGDRLTEESLLPTIQAVVERVVWEVVPPLAERLIREAIEKLQTEPPAQ